MSHQVVDLECPGCAAAISTEMKTCPKCYRPIVLSSFSSTNVFNPLELNKQANAYRKAMMSHPDNDELNISAGFCYLKLKLYDKSTECFEKALVNNFSNADAYLYAAVALLKGKKAFVADRKIIDKIVEYVEAAIMIEPKGIYYFFEAYIKYDYHFRKYYNTSPDFKELYLQAYGNGVTEDEINDLFEVMGVSKPDVFL